MGETLEPYEVRMQAYRERKAMLAPVLGQLMTDAKNVYRALRPLASHVSAVPMNYPLRHQQVSAINLGSGPRFVPVDDYLMIGLGDNHSLTLYQRNHGWEITRNAETEPLIGDETKIKESTNGKDISLEVSRYSYYPEWGHGASHLEFLCWDLNVLKGAEVHIGAVRADLTEAMTRHAG